MKPPLIITQLPTTLVNSPFIDAYTLTDDEDPVSALQEDLEDVFSIPDSFSLFDQRQRIELELRRRPSIEILMASNCPIERIIAAGLYGSSASDTKLWLAEVFLRLATYLKQRDGVYLFLEPSHTGAYIVPTTSSWLEELGRDVIYRRDPSKESHPRLEGLRRRLYEKMRRDLRDQSVAGRSRFEDAQTVGEYRCY